MANEVNHSEIDWLTLVQKSWGKEWKKPDIAYEWSNGRKFEDTTEQGGSFYEPTQ